MRRRYRIAHAITRLDLGGAQQNTLFCVEHHDRSRFEVSLVAGRGGILDAQARSVADARVDLVPWLRHPISPLADLRAVLRLRRQLRARRIDLLHTHSSKAGIVGRAAAFLAGVPAVVHTVHGWSFNDTQPPGLRATYVALERAAARVTDRLVTVCEGDSRRGLALGIGRPGGYRLVRSGIDVGAFRRPAVEREVVRRGLGYGPEDRVVGTLSALKPQKAPGDFVRAAAAARARDPRLKFFLAGDGALRPEVEREVRRLGLDDALQLLGWRHDAVDLLHAMDVFLLTSRFEGLPRAVLQAMAAGVPVVATAVDGTPEVVRDRLTGLLVPPEDPDAAAAAIVELQRDETLRRRCIDGASRMLGASFDIHRMVGDLERIYLELLEPG